MSSSCPGLGAEPQLPAAELDDTPNRLREEAGPPQPALQLETTGVTSQPEFWKSRWLHHASVVAKLTESGRSDLTEGIADCHTEETIRYCTNCGKTRIFYNRCDRFYCPLCQPRLSIERRESIEWWTREVSQPKHVVLTVRNSETITHETVKRFKAAWTKLRRSKFARNWRGGFYSLEVTNEGRGWHLHLHALVDARWIEARELARMWARCVGQDFAIVKVKDTRGAAYIKEVTKYAVKGSDLARWSPQDIAAFITAFKGQRTFGVFGTLFKQRAKWRQWLDQLQSAPQLCDCGCADYQLFTPNEWEWFQCKHGIHHNTTGPPTEHVNNVTPQENQFALEL